MKKSGILFLVLVLTLSCNKKQVYKKFENHTEAARWNEKEVKSHSFEILDAAATYSIWIDISHIFGTELNEFPVHFELIYPNGTVDKGEILVNFKNSDCLGDICDANFLLKENSTLAKGKYKVRFYPKSKFGFVPNIIGVGLRVEKKE